MHIPSPIRFKLVNRSLRFYKTSHIFCYDLIYLKKSFCIIKFVNYFKVNIACLYSYTYWSQINNKFLLVIVLCVTPFSV